MFKNKLLLKSSIYGIIISILLFLLFVVIVTGTTIYLLDPFLDYWIPIIVSFSIIFGILFVINIVLYAVVILNKNSLVKNPENEFSFWISSFSFWIMPILSWIIFLIISKREVKTTND